MVAAVRICNVTHRYRGRGALNALSLEVQAGETLAILGPNGSGKTTLFRLITTLAPLQQGSIEVFGHDVRREANAVRRRIGVVFQSPSLDKKLTVAENIHQQGYLYGLAGSQLRQRSLEMLEQFGLRDRSGDRVETLSGGLRRRVELAKGLLHSPTLLLLDEPSTGLDPSARIDLWEHLKSLSSSAGTTIVLTTHLLEEADRADRVAILDEGRLVALDAPEALRRCVGGDTITIETDSPLPLVDAIRDRLGLKAAVVDGNVRIEVPAGHTWIARLVEAFPGRMTSLRLSQPTLEDVFIDRTGHRFQIASRETTP
jgi:ABC-2 type transport system ATP-binding protein